MAHMDTDKLPDSLVGEEKADDVIDGLTMVGVLDPDAPSGSTAIDWTPEEERKAVWKQIAVVMPLMILGFFSLQLDRGNISQALTGTLYKDVGITQDQMNNGQSLLLVMIVLFEIPSNWILVRIGPKWWLGSQMIIWGVVAAAQSAIRSPGAYYATRVLLGIGESGFIPGSIYYISTMFTRAEHAKLVAWFYIGNICGKGSSGLIAAGLLPLQGQHGIPGWAYIFLVEGFISIGIGIIFLALIPTSARDCRTMFGFRWFTAREAHILHNRVIIDDPLKEDPLAHFTKTNLALVLGSWRLWLHVIFCSGGVACSTAVNTYNAQVVKDMGYPTGKANAMSSLGSWLQAPVTLLWGYAMDRTRFKGPLMLLITAIMLVLNGSYYSLLTSTEAVKPANQYAVYELIVAFGEPFFVGGLSWAVSTARTPIQRSMYGAMYVMASNSGQAIGGQMFRAGDAPKYLRGFAAALGVYGFCFALAVAIILQYVYANKHGLGDAGKEGIAHLEIERSEQDRERGAEAEVRKVFHYPT